MPRLESLLKTLMEEYRLSTQTFGERVWREYGFPEIPNMIQVAIGMRRVGKTCFLDQEIQTLLEHGVEWKQILYINFEDNRLLPMDHTQLSALLDAFFALYPENHTLPCYFFLDEIQNIQDWPIVIRRFMNTKLVKFYLTGSSAKLLSKEIASSLRGRSYTTEIWPYQFSEYLHAHSIEIPESVLSHQKQDLYKQYLTNYLCEGGFPAIQALPDSQRRTILQSYVDTVVYRDIIERYSITNISLMKYLVKAMVTHAATLYSPNKFFNDLKSQGFQVSKDTVYDYITHIEDAFLAFTIPLYSESLRKVQVNPKKIYVIDSGLVHAYTMSFSDNLGRLFENQVYLFLRKQGHSIYYYKTKEGYEVDFMTRDANGQLHLYQVAWDISDQAVLEREHRALKAAQEELQIPNGILVDPQTFIQMTLSLSKRGQPL